MIAFAAYRFVHFYAMHRYINIRCMSAITIAILLMRVVSPFCMYQIQASCFFLD